MLSVKDWAMELGSTDVRDPANHQWPPGNALGMRSSVPDWDRRVREHLSRPSTRVRLERMKNSKSSGLIVRRLGTVSAIDPKANVVNGLTRTRHSEQQEKPGLKLACPVSCHHTDTSKSAPLAVKARAPWLGDLRQAEGVGRSSRGTHMRRHLTFPFRGRQPIRSNPNAFPAPFRSTSRSLFLTLAARLVCVARLHPG